MRLHRAITDREWKVVDSISLNIGTVRLKEIFWDKGASTDIIKEYIDKITDKIPDSFHNKTIITIGGTTRALAKLIMADIDYPIEGVHGFEYDISKHKKLINTIIKADIKELKKLPIKKDRVDTY